MIKIKHIQRGCNLLQAVGFLACFVLFLLPACLYGPLTGSAAGIKAFQFIYFFSSFWNQFGPNCTTFLVAGAPFARFACCAAAASHYVVAASQLGITAWHYSFLWHQEGTYSRVAPTAGRYGGGKAGGGGGGEEHIGRGWHSMYSC